MPITIMSESQSDGDSSVVKINHKYEYPAGLNLHPDSPVHKKLVKLVLDRARYSHLCYTYLQVCGILLQVCITQVAQWERCLMMLELL